MLKNIGRIVTGAILIVFGWYFVTNFESFKTLLSVPILILIALVLLNLVRIYNNGQFMKYTLKFYGGTIGGLENYYLALLTAMGNFFGPFFGGAGIRAVYLKKKHKLAYSDFAATLAGFYFVTFIVNSFIGLVALLVIQSQGTQVPFLIYAVFLGWFGVSIVLSRVKNINVVVSLVGRFLPKIKKPFQYVNRSVKGWSSIKGDRALHLRLNMITIQGFAILLAITYLEFRAIGVYPTFAAIALYVSLFTLALLFSITPGALGVREAILIFTSSLMGLSAEQIVAIAIIDRSITAVSLAGAYAVIRIRAPRLNLKI